MAIFVFFWLRVALSQKLSQTPTPNQPVNFPNYVNSMAQAAQPNGPNMNGNLNMNANQFGQWRQQLHQQNQQNQQNALLNGLGGNLSALNALATQLSNVNTQFNPNMLINGMGAGNANNMAEMNYNMNNLNNLNNFNRLMNAAGIQNQMQSRQIHGMCRGQNAAKSGINFNGNMNQNKMPPYKMYSHF